MLSNQFSVSFSVRKEEQQIIMQVLVKIELILSFVDSDDFEILHLDFHTSSIRKINHLIQFDPKPTLELKEVRQKN